jgi:hypothetical protein
MSNVVPFDATEASKIAEMVLLRGDLSALTHAERVRYVIRVCESLGLNPLTKPFEYLQLNGKLVLYALKGCTDQLRRIHGISVTQLTEVDRDDVYIVTVHVQDRTGRTDISKGAVNIANLKGDALANAIMKAETKARRRATLSICGLGLLDESELETIPDRAKQAPKLPARIQRNLDRLKPRELPPPLAEEMRDELPGDLGPPKDEPSYADLVEGSR